MRLATLMVCGLALAVAAQQLHAQEPRPPGTTDVIDATLSNSVLQLRYLTPSPIDLGGTRSDLDYGLLLSEDRDIVGSAALMFDTDLNIVPRLTLEVGPQAYAALLNAQQKTDVFAIAFGANARYELIPHLGVAVFGSAFYSPSVVTFGNARNLYDFIAGGEIRFTPRLVGQAGYRWLKFTLINEPNDRIESQVFAGLRWALH